MKTKWLTENGRDLEIIKMASKHIQSTINLINSCNGEPFYHPLLKKPMLKDEQEEYLQAFIEELASRGHK